MAYTHIQTVEGTATGVTNVNAAALTSVASTDNIFGRIKWEGTAVTPVITDTIGNTYTVEATQFNDSNYREATFYCLNSGSGSNNVVNANLTASQTNLNLVVTQSSGLGTYIGSAFSSILLTPGSGTDALITDNINITSQPARLWGVALDLDTGGDPAAGTGPPTFTDRGELTDATAEDRQVTATGNAACYWTSSFGSHTFIVTAMAFTEAAAGTINTATLTDTLSSVDGIIQSALRGNISSDSVAIVDSFFLWWYRTLVLQSSVVVTEGSTEVYTTTNMQAIDELTIADEFVAWLRRQRLLDDAIAITDEIIASTIGYLIFISVLTSQLTIADESLPYRLFSRLLESGALTADQAMRSVFVARTLLDIVDVTDQGLTALQRFILLTDALSVDDSLSSLLVSPVTSNPVILIGFDQPRIEVGGYGL